MDFMIWGFPQMRNQQSGWFIREHPIKMNDLEVPLFQERWIVGCYWFLGWWKYDSSSSSHQPERSHPKSAPGARHGASIWGWKYMGLDYYGNSVNLWSWMPLVHVFSLCFYEFIIHCISSRNRCWFLFEVDGSTTCSRRRWGAVQFWDCHGTLALVLEQLSKWRCPKTGVPLNHPFS